LFKFAVSEAAAGEVGRPEVGKAAACVKVRHRVELTLLAGLTAHGLSAAHALALASVTRAASREGAGLIVLPS